MQEYFGQWGIIASVIGGLFVFVRWLDARKKGARLFRLEVVEMLAKLPSSHFDGSSKKDILLIEEIYSAIYCKSLTIKEIDVLLSAESPKRSFDMYVRNKQFLIVDGDKVTYRTNPVRTITILRKDVAISVHNIKHISGAIALIVVAAIQGGYSSYILTRLVATDNLVLKSLWVISGMGMLVLAVTFFALSFFLLTRIVNLPSRNILQQEFGNLFSE